MEILGVRVVPTRIPRGELRLGCDFEQQVSVRPSDEVTLQIIRFETITYRGPKTDG